MTADEVRPSLRVSIIAIMLFQVFALFSRSALDLSLVRNGIDRAIASDLSYLIVPLILVALLSPYLASYRHELLSLFAPERFTIRVLIAAVFLGFAIRITYWAALTVLMWIGLISNDDPNAIVGPFFGYGCPPILVLSLSLLVMAVLVPFIEEVINRGLLLQSLMSRGKAFSVVSSSVLFATMHHPGTYPVAFLIGLLLAVQMLNSRTLWAPIVTHAVYNATATLQWDCFQIIWNPPVGDPALTSAAWVAVPAMILGASICFCLVHKKAIGAQAPRRPTRSV